MTYACCMEMAPGCLVINLDKDENRRNVIKESLNRVGIDFRIVKAVTPDDIEVANTSNLNQVAHSVWLSHVKCADIALVNDEYSLILEDDADIRFNKDLITTVVRNMKAYELDMVQLGFLQLNLAETISIKIRNLYEIVVRRSCCTW